MIACRYKTHNFTDPTDNDNWLLLSYQQKPGQAASFVEHIKMGVQVCERFSRFWAAHHMSYDIDHWYAWTCTAGP